MSKRVAVVGNNSFPLDLVIGAQIVDVLKSLGDAVILTRKRPEFDVFVQHCSIVLGLRCLTYDAEGGLSNIDRDTSLINDCSELHAFVNLDDFSEGKESGTAWLIERALSAGIPTFAYSAVDGVLTHVGSPE